jgi:hypothetical protein
MLTKRSICFMICVFNIIAATILELNGIIPNDQVLIGAVFGIAAILVKEEKNDI